MTNAPYWIKAEWGGRVESPQNLAERFLRTVESLQSLHPRFSPWLWSDSSEFFETEGEGGTYPLSEIKTNMARAIERNVNIDDQGEAYPAMGYSIVIMTDKTPRGRAIFLSLIAGGGFPGGLSIGAFLNWASFEIEAEADPSLWNYDLWRGVMLILVETWEASWAEASPANINPQWTSRVFRCAWMSYVSPRFAPLITPPSSAIVEYRPNGGLFLAATREIFETANPRHVAVAHEIEAALLPLEKLPYPIDDTYK